MISKILITTGILIFLESILGIIGGIAGSFYALKTNESGGIGAVGSGILFALISSIGFFFDSILLGVGCIKLFRERRSSK